MVHVYLSPQKKTRTELLNHQILPVVQSKANDVDSAGKIKQDGAMRKKGNFLFRWK